MQYRARVSDDFVTQYSDNLGQDGMFIVTDEPPEVDESIQLQFMLRGGSRIIRVTAKVVRIEKSSGERPAGCAVRFTDLRDEDATAITHFARAD